MRARPWITGRIVGVTSFKAYMNITAAIGIEGRD